MQSFKKEQIFYATLTLTTTAKLQFKFTFQKMTEKKECLSTIFRRESQAWFLFLSLASRFPVICDLMITRISIRMFVLFAGLVRKCLTWRRRMKSDPLFLSSATPAPAWSARPPSLSAIGSMQNCTRQPSIGTDSRWQSKMGSNIYEATFPVTVLNGTVQVIMAAGEEGYRPTIPCWTEITMPTPETTRSWLERYGKRLVNLNFPAWNTVFWLDEIYFLQGTNRSRFGC